MSRRIAKNKVRATLKNQTSLDWYDRGTKRRETPHSLAGTYLVSSDFSIDSI